MRLRFVVSCMCSIFSVPRIRNMMWPNGSARHPVLICHSQGKHRTKRECQNSSRANGKSGDSSVTPGQESRFALRCLGVTPNYLQEVFVRDTASTLFSTLDSARVLYPLDTSPDNLCFRVWGNGEAIRLTNRVHSGEPCTESCSL